MDTKSAETLVRLMRQVKGNAYRGEHGTYFQFQDYNGYCGICYCGVGLGVHEIMDDYEAHVIETLLTRGVR